MVYWLVGHSTIDTILCLQSIVSLGKQNELSCGFGNCSAPLSVRLMCMRPSIEYWCAAAHPLAVQNGV